MAKRMASKAAQACCPPDEVFVKPRVAARRMESFGTWTAPNVDVVTHPTVGGKLVYLPLAPVKQGGQAQVKVILAFRMTNNESAAVTLTGVRFSFPGSSHADVEMKYVSREIASGESQWWSNGVVEYEKDKFHNNAVYLNTPAPSKIEVTLTFSGFAQPLTVESTMGAFACSAPGGAWPFPFSTDDLRPGEFYWTSAQHWANGAARAVRFTRMTSGSWLTTRRARNGPTNCRERTGRRTIISGSMASRCGRWRRASWKAGTTR